MTIYSKYRFDYHKGKQPGMVNAHLPLKMSLIPGALWYFLNALTCKLFVSYFYHIKDKFCLKMSDLYLKKKVIGKLYSDSAKLLTRD